MKVSTIVNVIASILLGSCEGDSGGAMWTDQIDKITNERTSTVLAVITGHYGVCGESPFATRITLPKIQDWIRKWMEP